MTEKTVNDNEKKEIPSFFMTNIMKLLSELETDIWDNRINQDKVKMQNIIILLKSELIQIDREGKDIISVEGFRYRRVFE